MWNKIIIGILASVGLIGCTLAPQYTRPALPTSEHWPTHEAYKNNIQPDSNQAAADIGWRNFFQDPYLQSLIEIALKNNRDLRVAILNIEKARATYRIQRADILPSISAGIIGTNKSSSNGSEVKVNRQYTAELGVSAYELDLFGRVRSLKNRELELFYASEEARRGVQLSLVSEVANAYLTLLADNENLRLSKATLKDQEKSYQLIQQTVEAGVKSLLDLNQAKTTVETARAGVALYTGKVAKDYNALTILLGSSVPDGLPTGMKLEQVNLLQSLPAGLPADLLQRRPDILEAEYQLKAANANIGAARAAFFPQISLTATLGTASPELSRLFNSGNGIWAFIPQITLPIFAAGKNKANLDLAHISKNIHIAKYEKAIQVAFKEVADALAERSMFIDQLAAQRTLTQAAQKTFNLSELRYREGIDSYLILLDSQRSLYGAQQSLIDIQLAQLTNLVRLYKVLGGGWLEKTTSQSINLSKNR